MLAIPGIILGSNSKVVVYYGKSDLALSCLTLPIFIVSLVDFSFDSWFNWAIKFLAVILVLCSVCISWQANLSIGKTILVIPTKFVLVGLISFCALLAFEGLVGGLKAQRKKDYEGETANLLTGAIGAFGVYQLQKLISKFVKEDRLQR